MSDDWTVVGKPAKKPASSQGPRDSSGKATQEKVKTKNDVPGYNGPMKTANQFQDFDVVRIQRKQTKQELGTKEQQVNKARQQGKAIDTEKRFGTGGNKQQQAPVYARKVDESEEAQRLQTVSMDVRRAIAQGRQAKGWTQKDLAQQVNEVPKVVNEYESGKAIPSPNVLEKLEKALGVKLRGKDIGTVLKH